jgi:hypothetical protein
VSVLAGPFAIAAILLSVGGALKAVRPRDTAQALVAVGMRFPRFLTARTAVRLGGALEAVVGVGALLTGGAVFAVLLAVSYLGFAVFVAVALRRGAPISSCGCFGKVDTPPSVVHLVLNVGAIVTATAVALGPGGGIGEVLADQDLLGLPFLLLVAIATYAAFLALTVLPQLHALETPRPRA